VIQTLQKEPICKTLHLSKNQKPRSSKTSSKKRKRKMRAQIPKIQEQRTCLHQRKIIVKVATVLTQVVVAAVAAAM